MLPFLIPLAIQAGGQIIGALKKSSSAKAAAKEQTASAQRASDYYTRAMSQLSTLYGPYINTGAGAINTIGRMITPGPGARYASPGPPNAMPQVAPPVIPPGARPRPPGAPTTGQSMPRGGYPPGPPPQGRPMAGPYYMAEGGDFMVNQPTMFVAGEAGPERASFSGGPTAQLLGPAMMPPPQGPIPRGGGPPMMPRQGGGQQLPMVPRRPMPTFNPQRPMANLYAPPPQPGGIPNPLSGRAGALGGGMRGGPAAAGANQLRRPMAGMLG
jgi:hypothetical protein